MKYLKYFLLVILQFAIVELVVWFHTSGLGWHISDSHHHCVFGILSSCPLECRPEDSRTQ